MLLLMIGIMCFFLILGFPMIVPLALTPVIVAAVYFPLLDPMNLVQQMLVGYAPSPSWRYPCSSSPPTLSLPDRWPGGSSTSSWPSSATPGEASP
jgi:hypothetical protein